MACTTVRLNGAKTIEEQKAVLTKVLKDQRDLLTKYVNKDVTQVPQVFIPYKEVLDVYHAGLQVPDEVTLMWCDDNYGISVISLQQKNVPVREETGYIIIYLIGGVRMTICGYALPSRD